MASRLVNITQAFTLSILRDGQVVKQRIDAGIQRLEEDAADHWYTKAHSAPVPKGVKQSDAEAAADAQREADEAELARMEAEERAAAEQAAAEAKAKADAEAAADAGKGKK
jgi:hypothetical protein